MAYEKIPIGRVNPAKYNPRKDLQPGDAEYEKLKRSILHFGVGEPIVWNRRTGNIVGGHQRYKVAKALGMTEIDSMVVDLDDQEEKALNIALNKISGSWDIPKLTELLAELEADGFNMELTGFDAPELTDIIGEPEVDEDAFDVEAEIQQIEIPITKPGDVWILGRHRLMCGDSTQPAVFDRVLAGKPADLIITDPPYNVDYTGGTDDQLTIQNDNMSEADFDTFLRGAYQAMHSSLKKGGAIYVFYADTQGVAFRTQMRAAGFKIAQTLIWVKNALVLGRSDYQWRQEPILYGWKEGAAHYYVDERGNTTVIDDKLDLTGLKKEALMDLVKEMYRERYYGSTILHEDKPLRNAEHPTMKPVKLIARLMMNSSRQGETILDPFGGSGSTMIAAEKAKRKCCMIELDPKYCDVIVKRWQELTGGTATREE